MAEPTETAATPATLRKAFARRRGAVGAVAGVLLLVVGVAGLASDDDTTDGTLVASRDEPTTSMPPPTEPEPATTTTAPPATTTTTAPPPVTTTTTAPARIEPRATRTGTPASEPRPGVRLALALRGRAFSPGETLHAVLTVENRSSGDLSYSGTYCSAYHQGLYRHGEWAGGQGVVRCTAEERPPVVIPPGQSEQVNLQFDGYEPATREGRAPLAPGTYQAAAGILVDGEAWFSPSVDVEIR